MKIYLKKKKAHAYLKIRDKKELANRTWNLKVTNLKFPTLYIPKNLGVFVGCSNKRLQISFDVLFFKTN